MQKLVRKNYLPVIFSSGTYFLPNLCVSVVFNISNSGGIEQYEEKMPRRVWSGVEDSAPFKRSVGVPRVPSRGTPAAGDGVPVFLDFK